MKNNKNIRTLDLIFEYIEDWATANNINKSVFLLSTSLMMAALFIKAVGSHFIFYEVIGINALLGFYISEDKSITGRFMSALMITWVVMVPIPFLLLIPCFGVLATLFLYFLLLRPESLKILAPALFY